MNKLTQRIERQLWASKCLLAFVVFGLVGVLLLASSSGVWATPGQSPLRQTIPGVISGTVFNDLNGNGVQDVGEPGIGGVTLTLDGITTTTTAADGAYSFTGVSAGSHTVVETDRAGFVSTTPNSVTVFVAAGGGAEANFGDQQQGAISGSVFNDLNGNGVQDSGEPGLASVTLTLDGATTTTTAGNGAYSFSGVSAGSHTVVETDPAGFVSATPNNVTVSAPANGAATANFGDQRQGTVSGTVFNDLNGNGAPDAGEPGIDGVTITLDGATTTTTAGNGAYSFTGVGVGSHAVVETDPAGFTSATPNSVTVSVPANGAATANFGDQQQGTVSGTVFNDLNGNGAPDAGEPGLSGVILTLDGATTAFTGGDGAYGFTEVGAGSHTVAAMDPAGFVSTTGDTAIVSVAAGTGPGRTVQGGAASANFGYQQVGAISGTVFNDLNGNGVQDAGESGIGGVAITLDAAMTTTTAGNGVYSFTGVSAGSHTVVETDPIGFTSSTPNNAAVSLAVGGAASVNFGDQQQGRIGGTVFNDLNGNGRLDAGEPGIGGVLVTLFDFSSSYVGSAITAGNGAYSFSEVDSGLYSVWALTGPAGFFPTTDTDVPVNLAGGGSASANFGYQEQSTLSGTVFNDLNGNGVQDAGEPGIGGITLTLDGVTTTTTAGNGAYSFSGVSASSHTVVETDPAGFFSTTGNSVTVFVAAGGSASANFGDQQQGTINGTVFNDLNANGAQDAGEPGIGGVTLSLDGVAATTTAGNGAYSFTGVSASSHTVVEIDPTGFTSTTPNSRIVSVAAGTGPGRTVQGGSASANFGDQAVQTIVGTVFEDTDGDGAQDDGEPGIAGVEVRLLQGGSVIAAAATNASGFFQFVNVPAGSYVVQQVVPSGYTVITTLTVRSRFSSVALAQEVDEPVTLPEGGAASVSFANNLSGSVSGVVFIDVNGNGARDAGEGGLGGVTINLFQSDGATLAATTTTPGNGVYTFSGLTGGTYVVKQAGIAGFTTVQSGVTVSLPADGATVANFANQPIGTISGKVFNDLNGNGVQDAGEVGIGGVTITLDGVAATTTAGNGAYSFSEVSAGSHTVAETDPEGFSSTTPNSVVVSAPTNGAATANFGDRSGPAKLYLPLVAKN